MCLPHQPAILVSVTDRCELLFLSESLLVLFVGSNALHVRNDHVLLMVRDYLAQLHGELRG